MVLASWNSYSITYPETRTLVTVSADISESSCGLGVELKDVDQVDVYLETPMQFLFGYDLFSY